LTNSEKRPSYPGEMSGIGPVLKEAVHKVHRQNYLGKKIATHTSRGEC
jgi:hypothetical protein